VRKDSHSYPIGDRTLPLEAAEEDVRRKHRLVGKRAEVSPAAGGDLFDKRGKNGSIIGVLVRLGVVIGYEVELGEKSYVGSKKDFYIERQLLEDIQPPTPTSQAIREGLSHWAEQRDYWGPSLGGIESVCFALASVTPQAAVEVLDGGWQFKVPEPQGVGRYTSVECRTVMQPSNIWTMSRMVYPTVGEEFEALRIPDHWARVFDWSFVIGSGLLQQGYPWEGALRGLALRAKASAEILRPLFIVTLGKALEAREELFPDSNDLIGGPNSMSVGFSKIRLPPGTVGLTEQPTDRRPYTVVSISPAACKSLEYLKQVVLHECIHIAVASNGGAPHNDMFRALGAKLGLNPKYWD
jgi:hypothetical protein